MHTDLKDIVLNYPPTHSPEEIRRILSAYKHEYPEIYRQWQEIERHPYDHQDDGLKDISNHGQDFLGARCDCRSDMARIKAWSDMRKEVIKSISS